MRAAVYEKYGPPEVVRIVEMPKPVPKDDEVLVRVRATTVSSGDWRVRSLSMPRGFGLLARPVLGLTGPRKKILGTELSGDVEAVGKAVSRFKAGDAVFAFPGGSFGCHAEYCAISESRAIALKPAGLSYEQAAALSFGGMTAQDFLVTKAKLQRGEKVLVVGASGAVGSAAVQLAKHYGAHVTGVCGTGNVSLVKSIGADRVIDYTREDFRDGGTYDLILVSAGKNSYSDCKHLLSDRGRLLLVLSGLPDLLLAPVVAMTGRHRVFAGPAAEDPRDIAILKDVAETGAFRPVIDRVYSFDNIVAAHAHVDGGRKKGSVVIRMDGS